MTGIARPKAAGKAKSIDVVVIGAGHSGLAVSYFLTERSVDHVVLERGEIANSWRRERWDSLTLLTPNWQTRLPAVKYDGDDPDGFMEASEVVDFIDGYARHISAPIRTDTTVTSVRKGDADFNVDTDRGRWRSRAVVIASGGFNVPLVPQLNGSMPSSIASYTPHTYHNPSVLDDGGVFVVGASATGLQIADEIQKSGRPVTLAVGEHIRMPRVYRGRDIQWWMDAAGILDERFDEVDDIVRARRVPSPQLVGTKERATLDLNTLTDRGARLVGRLVGIADGKAQFSGSLPNHCKMADLKLARLLDTIDEWADASGTSAGAPPPERYAPTRVDAAPPLTMNLKNGTIRSVIWATGFRPDYSWLDPRALDRKGNIAHDGGVAHMPGMYVLGLTFLRRRKSSFMHGAEDDARDLTEHLAQYLDDHTHRH